MLALLCSLSFAVAQGPASPADPPAPIVAPAEAQAIRQMIDDQIAAFRRDDAPGAWKMVAPGLQQKFGSADRFLEMVRSYYAPVYRPQTYTFDELIRTDAGGGLGQWMDVIGPEGRRVRALYLLERQADGSWRTSGCLLFEPDNPPPAV